MSAPRIDALYNDLRVKRFEAHAALLPSIFRSKKRLTVAEAEALKLELYARISEFLEPGGALRGEFVDTTLP